MSATRVRIIKLEERLGPQPAAFPPELIDAVRRAAEREGVAFEDAMAEIPRILAGAATLEQAVRIACEEEGLTTDQVRAEYGPDDTGGRG